MSHPFGTLVPSRLRRNCASILAGTGPVRFSEPPRAANSYDISAQMSILVRLLILGSGATLELLSGDLTGKVIGGTRATIASIISG